MQVGKKVNQKCKFIFVIKLSYISLIKSVQKFHDVSPGP